MIDIIIILILVTPIIALIDYFWLRKRYEYYHHIKPEPYFWLAPCLIEMGCFCAGILMGRNGF